MAGCEKWMCQARNTITRAEMTENQLLPDLAIAQVIFRRLILIQNIGLDGLYKIHFNMNDFPRRNQLDKCTPAELSITNAVNEVEKIGADTRLTNAIIKLGEARELVADFIDSKNTNKIIFYCPKCGQLQAFNRFYPKDKIFIENTKIWHENLTTKVPCREEMIEISEKEFIDLSRT